MANNTDMENLNILVEIVESHGAWGVQRDRGVLTKIAGEVFTIETEGYVIELPKGHPSIHFV